MTNALTIVAELKKNLALIYGPRLIHVILFGSQTRKDANQGSDFDVLVVLHGEVNVGEEIRRTGEFISELCLEKDVLISCVFMDEHRFVNRNGPLLRNIRKEGIAA